MAAAGALGISIEQVVVAALYAYSPQVHWASGVLDHVDVPVPRPGRPGALARLAGTGAGLDPLAGPSGQAFHRTGHPSTCVGCAAGHEDT